MSVKEVSKEMIFQHAFWEKMGIKIKRYSITDSPLNNRNEKYYAIYFFLDLFESVTRSTGFIFHVTLHVVFVDIVIKIMAQI